MELVEAPVRRVDQIKDSSIVRGRERPVKTIGQTIMRDLEVNGLYLDLLHGRTLRCRLVHNSM